MMYFLFPLVLYGGYVLFRKFDLRHVFVLVLAFFLLIPSMQFFMEKMYGREYAEQVFDADYIEEETTHAYSGTEGGMNRSTAINITNKEILTDRFHFLFGYGLGSGTISDSFKSSVFDRYKYTYYWNFSTSYSLIELGWVGTIIFMMCYIVMLFRFFKIYVKTDDKEIKYWTGIGVIAIASTFIYYWYNDNPYYKYLPMFFLFGICLVAIELRQNVLLSKTNGEE